MNHCYRIIIYLKSRDGCKRQNVIVDESVNINRNYNSILMLASLFAGFLSYLAFLNVIHKHVFQIGTQGTSRSNFTKG
jgi:hypothetical protein